MKKTERIAIRVNSKLKEQIEELAKTENRSMSNFLENIIREKLEEKEMKREYNIAAINAEYRNWLEDTIQADVKYNLDPAEGVVVEDLNEYMGLNLGWEEWNEFYEKNADYIKELEDYVGEICDKK